MDVIHDRVAGLDVHKDTVVAWVRVMSGATAERTCRTFGTTTVELGELRDWLDGNGCTEVAMEATGVYWKPVWNILGNGGGCPISCVSASREALYMAEGITDMAQAIRDEVIEELLQGYGAPQDLLGEEGLFKQLKKKLLERALGAELSEHLGYEKGDPAGRGSGNSRNGHSSKTVLGDDGAIELARPQRQLRAANRRQGADQARRFRRSDHQPLCPGSVGSRDPGAPAGALRGRGFPRSDQPGHRCGSRGSSGMAEPASRSGLSGDFLRCAAGQDPRRGAGAQQGGLRCCPRPQQRRRERGAGAVDRADRGRQVLPAGLTRGSRPAASATC